MRLLAQDICHDAPEAPGLSRVPDVSPASCRPEGVGEPRKLDGDVLLSQTDSYCIQMSPKNLAVVFAPTIMRDLNIEREMTDMHAKNLAIQYVIENTHTIFDDA